MRVGCSTLVGTGWRDSAIWPATVLRFLYLYQPSAIVAAICVTCLTRQHSSEQFAHTRWAAVMFDRVSIGPTISNSCRATR